MRNRFCLSQNTNFEFSILQTEIRFFALFTKVPMHYFNKNVKPT